MTVIEEELHTEQPAQDAADRVYETGERIGPEFHTGARQAAETEDWVYGVNRQVSAPLRSGLNFSYNALFRGTGVDERALPNHLRHSLLKETDKIVKKRRKFAKERSRGFTVPKEFEEAIGLVRDPTRRAQ